MEKEKILLAMGCSPHQYFGEGVDDYDSAVPIDIIFPEINVLDSTVTDEIIHDVADEIKDIFSFVKDTTDSFVLDIVDVPDLFIKDVPYDVAKEYVLQDQSGEIVEDAGECVPVSLDDFTCDGVDDDCDGLTDEDYFSLGSECGIGNCASQGVVECIDGFETDSCLPKTPSLELCDGGDNNCNGLVDDGCLNNLIGGYMVLYGPGVQADQFVSNLVSAFPAAVVPAKIELNGNSSLGIKLCDFTEDAGSVGVIESCLDNEASPLGSADELVYIGSPMTGKNEWYLMSGEYHIATLIIDEISAGLTFGPEVPPDQSACLYLFNKFACEYSN